MIKQGATTTTAIVASDAMPSQALVVQQQFEFLETLKRQLKASQRMTRHYKHRAKRLDAQLVEAKAEKTTHCQNHF